MTDPQETIAALRKQIEHLTAANHFRKLAAEEALSAAHLLREEVRRLTKMLDALNRWDRTPEPPRMSLSEIPFTHPPELLSRGNLEADGRRPSER
jgi:hypothetical protein